MTQANQHFVPPDWAFQFHGHKCPFMPLGYRMGILAIEKLGVEREKDHALHVVCELGEGHPQTCLMDGIQIATGATFGKTLIERTYWGKLAATFWYPGKTPVRYNLKPAFLKEMGGFEFFTYRKKGIEPSGIPEAVTQQVIDWGLSLPGETIYSVAERPDFHYQPPKGSFASAICTGCGELVFERYVRTKDGKPYCIPCSGYKG
ncbi:MAG: FmdE family protein [Acidobacteriota bacterium]